MGILVPKPNQRLHLQVAERIKELIAQGYNPGDILPKYRELGRQFGVGLVTVKRAMDVLTANGIVTPLRRRGTAVNRRLRSGERKIGQVAVVIWSLIHGIFRQAYLAELVSAILEGTARLDADVRLFAFGKDTPPPTPQQLGVAGVDAAILVGKMEDPYLARLAQADLPVVLADHRTEAAPFDCVACDNAAAARALLEHLAALGHRRVLYVGNQSHAKLKPALAPAATYLERQGGVLAAAGALGLEVNAKPCWVRYGDEPGPEMTSLAEAVRQDPGAPTALVAGDPDLAIHCKVQLEKLGVAVPQALSVAAVGGAEAVNTAVHGLTYCRMRFAEMGAQAVKLLELRCRTSGGDAPRLVRIGFDLVAGRTAAAPRPRPAG